MRRYMAAFIILPLVLLAACTRAHAMQVRGYLEAEARLFPASPPHAGQDDARLQPSLAARPEFTASLSGGDDLLELIPFIRLDAADPERTHIDFREASFRHFEQDLTFRLGMSKVYWGVTESVHIVDVINQTDSVEQPDGEEKLGQPMASLAYQTGSAELEFFLLPLFRERTFPGKGGRLRPSSPVDTKSPVYESSDEDRHLDLALRAAASTGVWDLGFSWFGGTSREPRLVADTAAQTLIPHYDTIAQFGIDLQATVGPTLLKFEAATRDGYAGQAEAFQSVATGVEHTLYGVGGSAADIGLLAEYLGDNRGDNTPSTSFEHDLFIGTRVAFNNVGGTTALVGAIVDLNDGTTLLSVESEGRLSDSWSLTLEVLSVVFEDSANELADVADDDHVVLRLRKYF